MNATDAMIITQRPKVDPARPRGYSNLFALYRSNYLFNFIITI